MSEDRKAFDAANVMAHDNLVYSVVSRVCRDALENSALMLDLLQEGRIAIIKAQGSYDPSLGLFSTWAYPQIRGAVVEYLRKAGYWVRRDRPVRQLEGLPKEYEELYAAPEPESEIDPGAIRDLLCKLDGNFREVVVRTLGLNGHEPTSFTAQALAEGVTPACLAKRFSVAMAVLRPLAEKMRKEGTI